MADPAGHAPEWGVLGEWLTRLLMGFVSVLVWVWGRERKALEDRIARIDADLETLRDMVEKRFERANEKTSDLSSAVQGIPDRLRREWREDFDREHQRHKRGRE